MLLLAYRYLVIFRSQRLRLFSSFVLSTSNLSLNLNLDSAASLQKVELSKPGTTTSTKFMLRFSGLNFLKIFLGFRMSPTPIQLSIVVRYNAYRELPATYFGIRVTFLSMLLNLNIADMFHFLLQLCVYFV